MKIIKLHKGLFRYLKRELPKQKSLKGVINFLKVIGIAYYKELIKMYKELFLVLDTDYIKSQQKLKKQKQIITDLQRALKMLQYIDKKLVKIGKNRQERRRFWRDFYKDAQVRTEVFNELEKEL